jgi:hypothetical protein
MHSNSVHPLFFKIPKNISIQVEDKQTEDQCMQAYWRMFTFNGQMNSLFTNGIRNDIIYQI